MADDPNVGGIPVAADEIGGVQHQRVKVQFGADGSATDVSATAPLPTSDAATSGVYGYATGSTPGTVDVPVGARVRSVAVLAATGGAATVQIAGGQAITVPAGLSWDEKMPGAVALGADVVIGGQVASYYVAWTT